MTEELKVSAWSCEIVLEWNDGEIVKLTDDILPQFILNGIDEWITDIEQDENYNRRGGDDE